MAESNQTPFSAIYDSDIRYVIYLHQNKLNNKAYVGQTCQKPGYRWGKQGKGYQNNIIFYEDILKYGWDEGFRHIILEEGLSESEVDERERFWIKYYDSYNNGYNLTSGGSNHNVFSDIAKKHLSNARKKYWNSEEGIQKRKEMSIIANTFWNSKEGKQKAKEHSLRISGENNPNYGGKSFNGDTIKKQSDMKKGELNPNFNKTGFNNHLSKPVYCEELNKFFGSGSLASKETKIDASSITRCCKNKQKTAGGYHWRYANEDEILKIKEGKNIG